MKFREFVNLIDDKVDYLFRRGKNADERCYDYFIRTVTFFVVVLIVLCYASFVHADSDISSEYTTIGEVFDYVEFFDSTQLNQYLSESNLTTSNISGYGILAGASYYRPSIDWIKSVKIPTSITLNDTTYTPEDYIIVIRRGNVYIDEQLIGVDIAVGNNIFIPNGSPNTIAQYNNTGSEVMAVVTGQFHSYSDTPYGEGYSFSQINTLTDVSTNTYNYNYFQTNMSGQYYYFIGSSMGYTIDGLNQNEINDFWYSYGLYPDRRIELNYQYALANPEEPEVPEVESNSNHMYLKYINASFYGSNNLADSNFVVSAKWDDWIEQHINDYECDIYFEIYYDGEPWKREVDGELVGEAIYGDYLDTVPLGVLSGGYITEFRTIANKVDINNQSLYAMIDNLQKSNMIIGTPNPVMNVEQALNGGSSEFSIKLNEINIGALYSFFHRLDDLTNQHAGETVVYVGAFHFDVTINIHDKNNRDIESGNFSRRWDFVNGTSSTIYDIYNNGNPWEGSTSEGTAISGQGGGSSINNSNIAYGGQGGNSSSIGNSNTVNVYGNGYQDTELHQLTKEDIEENHINIIRTIESLRDVFERFAEVKNEKQSFLQMIFTEFYEIPGVAYMVLSLIVVFSVMVIIFIIKIAF